MKKIFKVGIILLFIIIVCILVFTIKPQIFIIPYLKIKFSESKFPLLYKSASFEDISNKQSLPIINSYSKYGINFGVPFQELKETKEISENSTLYIFKEEISILIQKEPIMKLSEEFLKGDPEKIEAIKKMYGEEIVTNEFLFRSAVFNSNLSDLRFSTPIKDFLANSILLILKCSVALGIDDKDAIINIFQARNTKGFISSWPRNNNKPIYIVNFFDSNNNLREITIFDCSKQELETILNSIEFLKY